MKQSSLKNKGICKSVHTKNCKKRVIRIKLNFNKNKTLSNSKLYVLGQFNPNRSIYNDEILVKSKENIVSKQNCLTPMDKNFKTCKQIRIFKPIDEEDKRSHDLKRTENDYKFFGKK